MPLILEAILYPDYNRKSYIPFIGVRIESSNIGHSFSKAESKDLLFPSHTRIQSIFIENAAV